MSSLRQQIAVKKLSEIIGNSKGQKNISMGRILREAGYSNETSKTPQLVTESKGFKEELNSLVSDNKIIKTHVELFGAVKLNKMTFDNNLSDLEIKKIIEGAVGYKVRDIVRIKGNNQVICYYWSPDGMTRLKALDMGYKIKNLYPNNKTEKENQQPITVIVTDYGTKKKITT